jgi:hypothetical protein
MRGFISEIDVALARTGRTRDLWARNYLDLELSPEHRQTEVIRFKLFDHVCAHRKSVPAGLGRPHHYRRALRAGRVYRRNPGGESCALRNFGRIDAPRAGFPKVWDQCLRTNRARRSAHGLSGLGFARVRRKTQALQTGVPRAALPASLKKQPALLIEKISTSVNPERFEPLKGTIRAALYDPMVPPAEGSRLFGKKCGRWPANHHLFSRA